MQNKKNISDDKKSVNIKVENKEQIISNYSYDENDKLNPDLSDYIISKTKNIHLSQDLILNFYTNEQVYKKEIQSTITNHFEEENYNVKKELKKSNITVVVLLLLGVVTLAMLVGFYNWFSNFYLEMVLEIAAWVFIWEAIDIFAFKRSKLRVKKMQMQKILSAEVNVIENKKKENSIGEKN